MPGLKNEEAHTRKI